MQKQLSRLAVAAAMAIQHASKHEKFMAANRDRRGLGFPKGE